MKALIPVIFVALLISTSCKKHPHFSAKIAEWTVGVKGGTEVTKNFEGEVKFKLLAENINLCAGNAVETTVTVNGNVVASEVIGEFPEKIWFKAAPNSKIIITTNVVDNPDNDIVCVTLGSAQFKLFNL